MYKGKMNREERFLLFNIIVMFVNMIGFSILMMFILYDIITGNVPF